VFDLYIQPYEFDGRYGPLDDFFRHSLSKLKFGVDDRSYKMLTQFDVEVLIIPSLSY